MTTVLLPVPFMPMTYQSSITCPSIAPDNERHRCWRLRSFQEGAAAEPIREVDARLIAPASRQQVPALDALRRAAATEDARRQQCDALVAVDFGLAILGNCAAHHAWPVRMPSVHAEDGQPRPISTSTRCSVSMSISKPPKRFGWTMRKNPARRKSSKVSGKHAPRCLRRRGAVAQGRDHRACARHKLIRRDCGCLRMGEDAPAGIVHRDRDCRQLVRRRHAGSPK